MEPGEPDRRADIAMPPFQCSGITLTSIRVQGTRKKIPEVKGQRKRRETRTRVWAIAAAVTWVAEAQPPLVNCCTAAVAM
jgi:hypothetical protein